MTHMYLHEHELFISHCAEQEQLQLWTAKDVDLQMKQGMNREYKQSKDDIFDADDLLAIEQDAQSSSCSDSANDEASNNEYPNQADDECEKQSLFQQPQGVEGQTIHNSTTDVNVEDSDEDSDDGFLTSMLALGKKSAQDVSALALEEQEEIVQQESRRSDSSQHNFCGNDNADQSLATNENVTILLGDSAARWITDYQTCKQKHTKKNVGKERRSNCIYDSVISIQNSYGNSINDKPSALRLSVNNKRKRHSGGREVAEATLQQLDVAQNERKTLLHGQAELAPSAERSTLGTMVDCLARYDATKGCYVLEIVELDVSASTFAGKRKDDERSPSMEHPSTIADPRSRAKQAEKQVRKLKQGRGLRS